MVSCSISDPPAGRAAGISYRGATHFSWANYTITLVSCYSQVSFPVNAGSLEPERVTLELGDIATVSEAVPKVPQHAVGDASDMLFL